MTTQQDSKIENLNQLNTRITEIVRQHGNMPVVNTHYVGSVNLEVRKYIKSTDQGAYDPKMFIENDKGNFNVGGHILDKNIFKNLNDCCIIKIN